MDLSAHLHNRVMAILPNELDRLRAKAKDAPSFDNLQTGYETQQKTIIASYGDSDKPRLRNGAVADNGVAYINVRGALFNVESYWDEIIAYYFGGTSYQSLMRDIELVTNDASVKSVGFFVHSPGGEAFGMNETSNKIAALTAKKPTIGYAYGLAASAGYGLISATGEIYADANAWIGSIGTVMAWADYTGFFKQLGIDYEEVTSSNAPFKRLNIRVPEERAVFMSEIDGVEEVFIKFVAKARNVSVEKVKADFGQGAVMAGKAAKAAGMIDGIGSWDDVLRKLQTKAKQVGNSSANNSAKTGEKTMGARTSLIEKFTAWMNSEEIKPLLGADDEGGESNTTEPGKTEPAKPEAKSPALIAAEQEVQRLRAEQKNGKVEALKTKAENLATGEITAGRMLPTEKEDFVANYMQAATDDEASPLAVGSRVANLEALQSKRKSNGLLRETVNSDKNKIVFGNPSDEAKEDAEVLAQVDDYDRNNRPSNPSGR